MRLGSDVAVAVAGTPTTTPVRPLAWEPPCATGAALKKKKKKKKKRQKGLNTRIYKEPLPLNNYKANNPVKIETKAGVPTVAQQ